jgi:sucrose-6-phosphate hydrolase SacC (GH32 family)
MISALDARIREQSECFRLVYDATPRYVNDHCFAVDREGVVHLFHIVGPIGKGCYDPGSEESFGHATSRDLRRWQAGDDVLRVDPRSAHEPHHVFAPYVCEHEGAYHMLYAGINVQTKLEALCLARSADLSHWEKHPDNPVFRPSAEWAQYDPSSGIWGCCRDPHVIRHPQRGFLLYYVTWIRGTGGRLVAFGAAVSDDLVNWQELGPVMIREPADDQATVSLESPCVVEREGRYYLFYKHGNATRLVVSDDPFHFTDKEDTWFAIAHAAEVFAVGDRWYISSCSRELTDLTHERSDRTQGLYLACLEWDESGPRIAPFAPISA